LNKKPWLLGAGSLVAVAAAFKLALHLYAGRQYGFFVDELYYLDCARHLAWGYVDQPPLIALIAKVVHALFGTWLSGIRLPAALAGAGMVLLTGLLARELGGHRFAQGIAALSFLLAPGILALDHFFSMNAFEPLFWMGCALIVIRIIRTGNQHLWIWFGLLAGIGLENKHSMLIFGFGLIAGLFLTRERRILATPWLWIAGLLAFLIFLPNLIWNIQHHFPFLELQANIRRSGRDVPLSPLAFFAQETLAMLPLTLPIWLAGLWYLFLQREGKTYRALAWAWIISASIIVALSPRVYYLFPAYPLLFAAGGVAWERWLAAPRWQWVKPVYATLMILMAAVLAPTLLPLLPPETYIRYAEVTHLQQPRIETARLGPLPQLFADQFGWPEMAATVGSAFNSLPPAVRAKTCIFTQNYGQAGAIDLFGPQYGLPQAISGHQSHFLWGPMGCTGESVIVLAGNQEKLESEYASVRKVARVEHRYSMPYEHFDVFYCERLKMPVSEVWPHVKNWD
jgi:hypothetical protein